ncbi:MAG: lipid-A-disaccharide synthase [Lentimicrobiaceae bacterium]
MKYYIITGEASGDLHASNLIKALKIVDPDASFRGWGGDKMAREGTTIVKHYRDLAFMGFIEVVANLKTILNNLNFCKKDILGFKPDAVILIDYPGFNLQVARFLHQQHIRTIYYISPQVWAWKKSRVHTIKKLVDKLLVILPFEKDFFATYQVDAEFVGHPLLDALPAEWHRLACVPYDKRTVALLPGSRKQEIRRVLPIMLSVLQDFTEINFVIAGISTIGESFYRAITKSHHIEIVMDDTYNLLQKSQAALVTSGTATLETALIGVPEVVCYHANRISYSIARQLVKVKYISLVNLIMNRLVVKELIQYELNRQTLRSELNNLLNNTKYQQDMLNSYDELRNMLGGKGASERAANSIYGFLTA